MENYGILWLDLNKGWTGWEAQGRENMMITRSHGERLIRKGLATPEGTCTHDEKMYVILTRHDIQRTDHYLCTSREYS